MWPCAFIVTSVMQGRVADTKLWVHVPGTNDFRESTLTCDELSRAEAASTRHGAHGRSSRSAATSSSSATC